MPTPPRSRSHPRTALVHEWIAARDEAEQVFEVAAFVDHHAGGRG